MDIAQAVGAVTRVLTSREYQGQPARVIVATRVYDTTPDDLWDCLTNPERLPRWFLPVSGDLRPGGHYQLEGNAGGEITACEPPRHLALTWGMHGQASWVDVELSEQENGGTLLRLEHMAHVPDEFWEQYGPGAVGVGWDLALRGLGKHIETGGTLDAKVELAWPLSEEGKRFVKLISDDWATASIADDTPEDAARAAAERTTEFYTVEPQA